MDEKMETESTIYVAESNPTERELKARAKIFLLQMEEVDEPHFLG